jgi:hypothetical protein
MAASEGEAAEIRARGDAADQSLDATQSQKYLMRSLATLRLLEELFYQHADGMLDEVRWETNILRVRTFLRAPGFRAAWRTQSETFRSDFGLWIDNIMRETPVTSNPNAAAVSAWKEFSRQELARAQSVPS